jgi:predicted permease
VPLKDAMTADVRQPLTVLLAAVLLLLVTAAANVAGLQLTRAIARRREMAIRAALGAAHARVVRQVVAESLLLGLLGGAAGLLVASGLHQWLPFVLPTDFPRVDDVALDATVIVVALLVSIGAGVVFSLLPLIHLRRLELATSLSEDGSSPIGTGPATRVGRTRMVMMAGQVAIACVLLVGALLLGRSFLSLLNADRGYDPSGILTARVSLPGSVYSPERRHQIVRGIVDRATLTSHATKMAFTSELPVTPGGSTAAFTLKSANGVIAAQASPRLVSAGAFAALGMRIVEGRGFTEMDIEAAPPVAVVNRAFARRYLENAAVGATLPMGVGYQDPAVQATIVGVVDDVRYLTSATVSMPELYYSYRQFSRRLPVPSVTFLLRTSGDPRALATDLRAAIREADDALVPDAIATMEDRILTGLARPRLYLILFGGFAAVALIVVCVGLFAVLSQTVALRSREIGVRTALGARPSDILGLVARQGLAITTVGLVVGMAAAAMLAQSMASFLYGVTPHDRISYVLVPLLLLAVATIACLGPALRAIRVDPVRVLRGQ